jgi:LytR cell envelope-related transcriptional attenuator
MVMVLLFLGVIFLLLGFRALGSSGNSDEYSSTPASSAASSASAAPSSTSEKPAPAQAEVRVYNVSSKDGAAARVGDQLKAANFKVTEVTNLSVSDISATTVYYTDADGEKATAEAVGKALQAPVERRISALVDQPPGVIVLVTG